jgi:hypothetical protein
MASIENGYCRRQCRNVVDAGGFGRAFQPLQVHAQRRLKRAIAERWLPSAEGM